ncbi:MAG: hypothetical protein ACRDKW_02255 [Actinomycetota bacterium]
MCDRGAPLAALVLSFALLMAGAGCQSARSSPPPGALSSAAVGELTGTWTGTWGGTPLTLVIVEHTESAPYSGLYFGPWLVAGGRYPGIAGVLTYTGSGAPTSVAFNGRIHSSRPLIVFVLAQALDGQLQMRLRGAGTGRLTGEGQSTFRWGPQGPVELTRP